MDSLQRRGGREGIPIQLSLLSILWLSAVSLDAEIIDRIAVAIDNQVIAESQVLDELRITAFLNGVPPDYSPATKRATANRLVDQTLIRREMELTRYPEAQPSDIEPVLRDLKSRYGGEAQFESALKPYRVTGQQVQQALLRQAAALRFIDLRFKPEVQVQEPDVRQYYENVFVPECRRKQVNPIPSFEEARDQCEQALTAELVDKRVDAWLKEFRTRTRIRYEEDAFQ